MEGRIGQVFRFRESQVAQRTYSLRWEKKIRTEPYPVVYRFRQAQSQRACWRFRMKRELELYQEQGEQKYMHRGRRLYQEYTQRAFSFLLRGLGQEKLSEGFSFLIREMAQPEAQAMFSFLLRQISSIEKTVDFSFLIRELGAEERTENFSFLIRQMMKPEQTVNFSFIFRYLQKPEQLTAFSFLIRELRAAGYNVPMQRERSLPILPEAPPELFKKAEAREAISESQQVLQCSQKELQSQEVQQLCRGKKRLETGALIHLSKEQADIEQSRQTVLDGFGEKILSQLLAVMLEVERHPELCWEENLQMDTKEKGVSADQTEALETELDVTSEIDSTLALESQPKEVFKELGKSQAKRMISKDGITEVLEKLFVRDVAKRLYQHQDDSEILYRGEKGLNGEQLALLGRWVKLFVEKPMGLVEKVQELELEAPENTAVKLLHELCFEAANWRLMKDAKWLSVINEEAFLDKQIQRDFGMYDGERLGIRFSPKYLYQTMTEHRLHRLINQKDMVIQPAERKLDYTRWLPIRITLGEVRAERTVDLNLQQEERERVLQDEKALLVHQHLTVEKEAQMDVEESVELKTEHESVVEPLVITSRKQDQLQREKERSAELFRRFWTISQSGFTDRIVLPDMDYPYTKQPIEFAAETQHNENWDSVYPNEFYRRINRHPIREGAELALEEIPVDIAVMVDLINIYIMMWFKYVRAFWGWTGTQAVLGMVSNIYEYLMLETSREWQEREHLAEDYARAFRWLRWEAEAIALKAGNDMELHGNYYVGLLLEELIAYMENHHFDTMPLFCDVNKMDEWRTLFDRPLQQDITWVLDKVKGIRHKVIERKKK